MLDSLADDDLLPLVRAATGRAEAVLGRWHVAPAAHCVTNMTTSRLDRVSGALADGTAWALFAKTLHPASASPLWCSIPQEHHATVLEELDWLDEPRVYASRLRDDLPEPLRLPAVHRIDERGDRLTIWMEDVADVEAWDLDRYRRTAMALGRLGARWPEDRVARELGLRRRRLDTLFFGKVCHADLPVQADDGFWADADIAAVVDGRHRDDLRRAAAAVPGLLARLERLPHGMAHGDATPDNFREPGDGSLVALDWSYGSSGPLGSDLGQLLAGRLESGAMDAADIPAVAAAVFAGYLDGLRAEGRDVDPDDVEEAWAAHLAVRSVFSALLLDPRPELTGPGRAALLARRAALGRFGLDLVERVSGRR